MGKSLRWYVCSPVASLQCVAQCVYLNITLIGIPVPMQNRIDQN